MYIEGVDGSEYGRFRFSPIYEQDFRYSPCMELEYEYHNESSPPVDIYESQYLSKDDVRRLVIYLNKWLEENG